MNPLGTNYAEQIENNLPDLYKVYVSDFENAGITLKQKKDTVMSLKKLYKQEKQYGAPLFDLLFESEHENPALFVERSAKNRESFPRWVENEKGTYVKGNVEDSDVFMFKARRPHTKEVIRMSDIYVDDFPELHWNKRDALLKDIAYFSGGLSNMIPTQSTQKSILDLLKTKIALITWHRIKKRTLSFLKV